jgi:diaminohydroxyphosphoribosylaminopyrimidine deaminase / 5-amino-6-(5-phosphoribosylamino)uracil reductase
MVNRDTHFLRVAARLALRGHGGAEPNPMVGCVIVSQSDQRVVGWGYHRQCGGPHAEAVALKRAGSHAHGATLYCTLEPCNHTGRTPPCVDAILSAGIERVVMARRDPHPVAAGGCDRLREAGVAVEINENCEAAIRVSDPFVHRISTGLPWVIAKWAQSLDGKIATRPPHCESQWISNTMSRKMVHRERGRVDAILTGIGTVLKDDPQLTARNIRIRRVARRIILDPRLQTPLDAKVITSPGLAPTTIVCEQSALVSKIEIVNSFQQLGIEILPFQAEQNGLPMRAVLLELARRYAISTLLVEAGSGLLSRLFDQQLVNQAWVFMAPIVLGDNQALSAIAGKSVSKITDADSMKLDWLRRRGDDVIAQYLIRR